MAKTFNFPVGQHHVLAQVKGGTKYDVSIDGNPFQTFKISGMGWFTGANDDFTFVLDGVTYVLAARKKSLRIASGGVYLDNGEAFVPAQPPPKWTWAFVVLNLAIPVLTLGGLFPILLAVLGITACSALASSRLPVVAKVLLCLLATAAMYGLTFFLVSGTSLLLSTL